VANDANLSVDTVSLCAAISALMLATKKVRLFPPMLFRKRKVSVLLLYGSL
jgi:hypothetical protein